MKVNFRRPISLEEFTFRIASFTFRISSAELGLILQEIQSHPKTVFPTAECTFKLSKVRTGIRFRGMV